MKQDDTIAGLSRALGPEYAITDEIAARLQIYADQLVKWQKAINLVSAKTLPDLWQRHIWDSLQLVPLIPATCRTLVDLGSGAGLPGLILALFTRWDVHLIESDTRKAVFLREAARACGVAVAVHAQRIEKISGIKADVITARALAPVDNLLSLAENLVLPQTEYLFLKGRHADLELTEAQKNWTLQVERIPSVTDPFGVILKINEVCRHDVRTNATS